ncbi:MAG: zinc dependent phospholipase C family protein [Spirochaetota bacterium]
MPGIITHSRVFYESINFLKKEKHSNIYSKSIEILFKSKNFKKAGLFGALGPNIFAYLPFKKNNYISGSEISYELHSNQNEKLLKSMLFTLISYKDQNNEWASNQRAYLYGLISHLISDSFFNPYIYYWSGFTTSGNKAEQKYFREQHLLLENNLDVFFSQPFDGDYNKNPYDFNLDDMLPEWEKYGLQQVEHPIKTFLLNSIKEAHPETYNKLIIIKQKDNEILPAIFIMNLIPIFIKFSFKIKNSRNPQLIKIINYIKKKKLFYSDYLIKYPPSGKLNTHVLNLHKERWFHPTGSSGLHYESVKDLLFISCERIADIWKKIEEILFSKSGDTSKIENELKINAITGVFEKDFNSMNLQNPIHLHF